MNKLLVACQSSAPDYCVLILLVWQVVAGLHNDTIGDEVTYCIRSVGALSLTLVDQALVPTIHMHGEVHQSYRLRALSSMCRFMLLQWLFGPALVNPYG